MKLSFLLALVPCAVSAQNFQAMPRLKPILPRLDQPWTKTHALRKPALVDLTIAPAGTAFQTLLLPSPHSLPGRLINAEPTLMVYRYTALLAAANREGISRTLASAMAVRSACRGVQYCDPSG